MITIDHLTKWYRSIAAIDGVSFDIGPRLTGFLGPNSAGKTTTQRMLPGLTRPCRAHPEDYHPRVAPLFPA